VASPEHLSSLRDGLRLSGRVLRFASTNLATAFACVKTNQPKLVAIESTFARTPEGGAFVDRIAALAIEGCETRLVARVGGTWATMPLSPGTGPGPLPVLRPAARVAEPSRVAAAARMTEPARVAEPPPPVDVKSTGLNTRRAPRFLVLDPLKAVVENANADLVDLSVLGAQVVSASALRPNQKIKLALVDGEGTLRITAHVAWSHFEKPKHAADAYYRAGMEFTDAAKEVLEDFCRRHCWEDPLPYRGGAAQA
jgi:hypothetical protein